MQVAFTQLAAASFGNTGNIYRFPHNASVAADFNQILTPIGVNPVNARPSIALVNYNGKSLLCVVGGHTDNIIVDQFYRAYRQGMIHPHTRPTIAASGTGITGSCIGYISFWDNRGRRRSRLSAGSTAVTLTNQGRSWTNLPTHAPDEQFFLLGTTTVNASTTLTGVGTNFTGVFRPNDRVAVSSAPGTYATIRSVDGDTQLTLSAALGDGTTQTIIGRRASPATHVELWVSMDGALPRLALRVDLGVTSFIENVATLSLGEANTQSFSRFPRCKYNTIWHSRQWMTGDSQYPNRIYYSVLNDYENMEGYLETRNGKTANGLYGVRDMLFVGCGDSHQRIQGWTLDDFSIEIADNIGLLSHFSVQNIFDGYAIFAWENGLYLNSGSIRFMSEHYTDTFCAEYENNQADYENCFSVDMRADKVYKLHTGTHSLVPTANSVYWVLDYSKLFPQAGGNFNTPQLTLDAYGRTHDSAWLMSTPGGIRTDVLVGTCSGLVLKETRAGSSLSTKDDAGDPYGKHLILDSKVHFFGEHGGDQGDGFRFSRTWFYVESEESAWTLRMRGGDERCHNLMTAMFAPPIIPKSFETDGSFIKIEKCRHVFDTESVVGHGMHYYIDVTNAKNFFFRGMGGTKTPNHEAPRGNKAVDMGV